MKIFEKRKDGRRRRIYLCGIKVLSYSKKKKDNSDQLLKVLYDTYNEANYTHKLSDDGTKKLDTLLRNINEDIKKEATELGLWDENYYIKLYPNIKYYNMTPWDHYIKYGWKLGLNPSKIFDAKWYRFQYSLNVNPLVHFLTHGRYHCYYGFRQNPYPVKPSMLKNYLTKRGKKRTKKVVYTALVGDYDELIIHSYLNPDWDYVCFTNNEKYIKQRQIGPWKIHAIDGNLGLDAARLNRYYKINPHIVLPEYDESIYIDSNINILTPFIFDYVQNAGKNMVVPSHFDTFCIYKHFEWAYKHYVTRPNADAKVKLDQLLAMIRHDTFPKNYGFTENNLLYRKHNLDAVKSIMNDWWYLIKWYVARDQLSFCYVLYRHNIRPQDLHIDNLRSDNANFAFVIHKQDARDQQ